MSGGWAFEPVCPYKRWKNWEWHPNKLFFYPNRKVLIFFFSLLSERSQFDKKLRVFNFIKRTQNFFRRISISKAGASSFFFAAARILLLVGTHNQTLMLQLYEKKVFLFITKRWKDSKQGVLFLLSSSSLLRLLPHLRCKILLFPSPTPWVQREVEEEESLSRWMIGPKLNFN